LPPEGIDGLLKKIFRSESCEMTEKRLQIKNVSVKFGGLFALDDVSFEVDDNQLLGFIGPNGAGKTTFNAASLWGW
jgi:branched-chain amino acid transport system ATP-binding protein